VLTYATFYNLGCVITFKNRRSWYSRQLCVCRKRYLFQNWC